MREVNALLKHQIGQSLRERHFADCHFIPQYQYLVDAGDKLLESAAVYLARDSERVFPGVLQGRLGSGTWGWRKERGCSASAIVPVLDAEARALIRRVY